MATSPEDVLLHPVRLRIVLAIAGQQLTAQQLQQHLDDVPHATLYRHISRLRDAGILEVVAERAVRGGVERTFALVEGAASFAPDDIEPATAADLLGYFTRFVATLIGDFARYLDTPDADPARDGVGFRQIPLWLSDAEFEDFAAEMTQLLQGAYVNQSGGDRKRRVLSTIVMPGGALADREN